MNYYNNERIEMLPFVPDSCKKVLEIGCGEGLFASLVKSKFGAEVWGIEISEEAAAKAREKLDKVISGDLSNIINLLPNQYFDCIIFNDVLEHFVNPYEILEKVKVILASAGFLVSSIPNVRHISNLRRLLIKKDWKYKPDGGILDITHLRFFTKKSIIRMFEDAGYEIIKIKGINPVKDLRFSIFNIITFGFFADSRYLQFGSTVRARVSIGFNDKTPPSA